MTLTASALFFGLGARILLDKLSASAAPVSSVSDHVFSGVWQGAGLHYVLVDHPHLAPVAALVIGSKLLFDYALMDVDMTRTAATILGLALGVLVTDILSQLVEDSPGSDPNRLVQLRARDTGSTSKREPASSSNRTRRDSSRKEHRLSITAPPSISLDSNSSTIDPHGIMTPLEREVAELRARASLADTERRRFKEERKWALSQGNRPRASQMAWQVKRYAALMESFNREADAKLIQAARLRGSARDGPSQGNRVEIPPNRNVVVSTGRSDVRFDLRNKR